MRDVRAPFVQYQHVVRRNCAIRIGLGRVLHFTFHGGHGGREYVPITVRFTCELRVGLLWKSTRQRYAPVSELFAVSMANMAGAPFGSKMARPFSVCTSDQ